MFIAWSKPSTMNFLKRCHAHIGISSRRYASKTAPHRQTRIWNGTDWAMSRFINVSEEVGTALAEHKPVVALESAVYTHGFPVPENLELAKAMEQTVRENGAIPATICIIRGKAVVGLSQSEMEEMAQSTRSRNTVKVSRRDLSYVLGVPFANPSESFIGGTTIAGTSAIARIVGIKVFATGGLGGVHRGTENTMDVSADLTELGRTNIAVISSGSKAFLDLEKTLEYLETMGVYVGTFGSRTAEDPVQLPAFYSRGCGILSPSVVENPAEAAAIIYASRTLGLQSGQLFANPVPAEHEIPHEQISSIIAEAVHDAEGKTKGKDVTPFILNDILRRTEGKSITANRALLLNNAAMGAKVAVELQKIYGTYNLSPPPISRTYFSQVAKPGKTVGEANADSHFLSRPLALNQESKVFPKVQVAVIGGVAVDVSCDIVRSNSTSTVPSLHTSNPSQISETLGGVANNVAYALYLSQVDTVLVSSIGDDISGAWVRSQLRRRGMDTSGITTNPSHSTARYVAVNDSKGGLFVAAADMAAISAISGSHVRQAIGDSNAEWVVFDGNLAPETIADILKTCQNTGAKPVFEPTSSAKSTNIFTNTTLTVFPKAAIYGAAPNIHEISSMYMAADNKELFSTDLPWWNVIDSLNLDSNFRNRLEDLTRLAGVDLVTPGTIQKAINLSPYVPNLFIKLGAKGCLVVRLLSIEQARDELKSTQNRVMRKAVPGSGLGGILVQYYSPESIPAEDVVSVNGAGDTFLGVLVAGLVKGLSVDSAVEKAQTAAVATLRSKEAVGSLKDVWTT